MVKLIKRYTFETRKATKVSRYIFFNLYRRVITVITILIISIIIILKVKKTQLYSPNHTSILLYTCIYYFELLLMLYILNLRHIKIANLNVSLLPNWTGALG